MNFSLRWELCRDLSKLELGHFDQDQFRTRFMETKQWDWRGCRAGMSRARLSIRVAFLITATFAPPTLVLVRGP